MTLPPPRAFGWTVSAVLLAFGTTDISAELAFAISIILLSAISARSVGPLKTYVAVSVPLFFPLVLIHGVVNPHYAISQSVFNVPVREEGVRFAFEVFAGLSVFLSVAISWLHVNRDLFFDWLVDRRVPLFLMALVGQSIAMVTLIEKRGIAVNRAQTARGIATGPGWIYRLRALPSMVLPVITSLINEAAERSTALWSRGFLQFPFPTAGSQFGLLKEVPWILGAIAAPLIIIAL